MQYSLHNRKDLKFCEEMCLMVQNFVVRLFLFPFFFVCIVPLDGDEHPVHRRHSYLVFVARLLILDL